MKKYLALLSLFFVLPNNSYDRKVFAHSFMYTKPAFYDIVMEQALWHDIAYNKKGPLKGGFQAIPFYQESMQLKKNDRYFLFKGKTELTVVGDNVPGDNAVLNRDIRAEWVNLPSNFSGVLSLSPKQKQIGCFFEYHQDLKNWVDIMVLRDMYITFQIPVSETENNIHLTQTNVMNPAPTFPQDILQAFDQPTWEFSRISNCQKKRIGVAELKIKIGTSYISEDYFQLNYYSILAIPTGNKQSGRIMFEAVNGNNHHLGIGGGINMQAPLNRDTSSWALCVFLDLESMILIRNKQFRTYDLFDQLSQESRPWSRFLLINKPIIEGKPFDLATTTNLPGVNFLTQKIYAKPFNVVDFALGWRLTKGCVEAEAGYSIWGHPTERTNLNHPITEPFGIAGSAPGKTASRSTIAQQAPDDLDFVPITTFDLDRTSGESSGGFVQRGFVSLGLVKEGNTIGGVVGIGASFDVPFETSILQLGKVWGKISLTF